MKKFLIALLLVSLAGCASTSVVDVDPYDKNISYPPTDPQDVEVFRAALPNQGVTKIAEITLEGLDWTNMETEFKKQASKLGADAVYLIDKEKEGYGSYGAGSGMYQTILTITGVAVKKTTE